MGRTFRASEIFSVFLVYLGLGFVFAWPLPAMLFDAIPYAFDQDPVYKTSFMFQGDHIQAYYHFRLLKEAALGRIEWFTNPYEFATEFQQAMPSYYFLPLSVVYLPLSFISDAFAYNVFMLLALAAGGLGMYLWAKELTGDWLAAFIAGLVFNFIPLRLVELFGGHPSGHAIFLVPLTLFFFDRAVRTKSPLNSALAGVCILVLALQYSFFSYFLLMFLMAYIPWKLAQAVARAAGSGDTGREITRLAAAGVPFALGILAAIGWMYYFKTRMVTGAAFSGGRTMEDVALFSPPLPAMWAPGLNWTVYLGLPFFGALAWAVALPSGLAKNYLRRWDALFFLAVFALTYILAFGATLDGKIPVYSFFYHYFPFFKMSRTPVKVMVVTVSALSILIAYLIEWARSGERTRRKTASAIAMALAAVTAYDYHPNRDIGLCVLDFNNGVYKRIAQAHDEKKTLNIPIWPGESSWASIYQFYAVESGTPTINGYTPLVSQRYIDNVFWPLFSVNTGDLSLEQIDFLKRMNVGYIVFHQEAYPPKVSAFPQTLALERLEKSPYLKLAAREDPLTLFRILDKPKEGEPSLATSPIGHMIQAEWLYRRLGQPAEDPSALGGAALAAGPAADEGFINAGPYKTFPAGTFKAVFRLKVDDNSAGQPVVRIDAAADQGRHIAAQMDIRGADFARAGEYQDFVLPFTLAPGRPWQVEFRAYLLGPAMVYFDSVYVTFADRSDPAWEYEAEEMYYTGRIIADHHAKGGKAVMSTPGRDPADVMAEGPGRFYEAGKYRVHFRMKTQNAPAAEDIASIEARSSGGASVLGERKVTGGDLPSDWRYGEAAMDYTLPSGGAVEFRVKFLGKARFAVDGFRIERAE